MRRDERLDKTTFRAKEKRGIKEGGKGALVKTHGPMGKIGEEKKLGHRSSQKNKK